MHHLKQSLWSRNTVLFLCVVLVDLSVLLGLLQLRLHIPGVRSAITSHFVQ